MIGVGCGSPRGGGGGGGGGSLSVGLSDSTPNFGDTITITATPTGITPTSYTYVLPDGTKVTQAGNTYDWVVNESGSQKVIVTATDGVDVVANSATATIVTIYAKHGINHAYVSETTSITLVDGLVDSMEDIIAGADADAVSAVARCMYQSSRVTEKGSICTDLTGDYLLSTVSTIDSEVTIYGVFDNNGTAQRGASTVSILLGGSANRLTSVGSRFDVLISGSVSQFKWTVRDSSGGVGGRVDPNLPSGKVVFVGTYDGTTLRLNMNGTIYTDTYAGSLFAEAGDYTLFNGQFPSGGTYNGNWTLPTSEIGIKRSALSTTDADQLYADLLLIYPS